MHLWASDFVGGDDDEGYDLAAPRPPLSAVRPNPACTSDEGWELSSSGNAWGAPTSSKLRSVDTSVRTSPGSSMAPAGIIPTVVEQLKGPIFSVPTPFKGADQDVDEPALTASLTFMKSMGVANVIACDSIGECAGLTIAERQRVTAVCATVFPTSTMANISAGSYRDAVALERQAQWVGCTSILLAPPPYPSGLSQEGVEAFLSEVQPLKRQSASDLCSGFRFTTDVLSARFSGAPRYRVSF